MDEKKKLFYYQISVALGGSWKNNSFTYSSDERLEPGNVVIVPFGSMSKLGFVDESVAKPDFKTKKIIEKTGVGLSSETLEFAKWIDKYYPGPVGANTQLFLPSLLKTTLNLDSPKTKKHPSKIIDSKPLTKGQKEAYEKVTSEDTTSILHGITGSGKTRLYCELAKKYLEQGKNVLILYPEISLTSQLEKNLKDFFGSENTNIYHSKRTTSQQKDTWLSVFKSNGGNITIGPRSAIFLPHKNLGLIIIDEAHDSAYKQDSGSRYNSLNAVGALSKIHKSKLVLGSATPPVTETWQILSKAGSLICMHDLAIKSSGSERDFKIVDMVDVDNRTTNILLSKVLLRNIEKSLEGKKQSLLFLNRRGTARLVMCENCGWHAECPRCEMPLTHHHDSFKMQCHLCGYSRKSINVCEKCSSSLSLRSLGTKAVVEELKQLFPNARIARFDSDNKKAESFAENFESVVRGNFDIIVGTQIITKGIDLPELDTVGILQADSSLLIPDFSSEERAFQQLLQVSGRVGRGHSKNSSVIVQTYQPDSFIFKYVEEQDWHGFYEQELEKRKSHHYPPFSFAMKIWLSKKDNEKARVSAAKLAQNISLNNKIKVLGPAPGFHTKKSGSYIWQIILLTNSRKFLTELAKELPADFLYDLDPSSLI